MAILRRNEWNFASTAAQAITRILQTPKFINSPLGRAEAELTELRGARRLDLVLFHRTDRDRPVVTAETKAPWAADGRTPFRSDVVEDAHAKASRCGAEYFITWNIKRAVVWRTDDPGVPLDQRAIHQVEIVSENLTSQADLARPQVIEQLEKGITDLVGYLDGLFTG